MILHLLRLFSTFRDLEALADLHARNMASLDVDLKACRESHEELSTEKLRLQDRVDVAEAEVERVWELFRESLGNERIALRTMVNHATQRSGGGVPFPEAHSLPPNATPRVQEPGPIGRRGRMLPSQLAAQANAEFIRKAYGGAETIMEETSTSSSV